MKTCSFENCNKPHRTRGLCKTHYEQQRLGKPLTKIKKINKPGTYTQCTFKGCERPHSGKGLCRAHYKQKYKSKIPLRKIREVGKYSHCTFKGCQRKHSSKGLCKTHWQQKYISKIPLRKIKKQKQVEHRKFNMTYTEFIEWCLGNAKIINGCLNSQASLSTSGCPRAAWKRKSTVIGRHILTYFKGKPKKNQVMFHICNNKLCILPSHLKWATQKENNQYIFKSGRNRNQYSP